MRSMTWKSATTVALLATAVTAAGAATVERPERHHGSQGGAQLSMKGTMWDFYKASPAELAADFATNEPEFGRGLYIGLMAIMLDGDGKPVKNDFATVATFLWQNASDQNIVWERPYISTLAGDHEAALRRSGKQADPGQ